MDAVWITLRLETARPFKTELSRSPERIRTFRVLHSPSTSTDAPTSPPSRNLTDRQNVSVVQGNVVCRIAAIASATLTVSVPAMIGRIGGCYKLG